MERFDADWKDLQPGAVKSIGEIIERSEVPPDIKYGLITVEIWRDMEWEIHESQPDDMWLRQRGNNPSVWSF